MSAALRANGFHELDEKAERDLLAWAISPASARLATREPTIPGRQCGCSQNFTVQLHRCPNCPVVSGVGE